MREPRRRRQSDDGGGGIPLFPLVLVVILAGLLLGGVFAHFFGCPTYSEPGIHGGRRAAFPNSDPGSDHYCFAHGCPGVHAIRPRKAASVEDTEGEADTRKDSGEDSHAGSDDINSDENSNSDENADSDEDLDRSWRCAERFAHQQVDSNAPRSLGYGFSVG